MRKEAVYRPGVVASDTETKARYWWRGSNRIRFVRGLPQKLNGWDKHLDDEFPGGTCRGMLSWLDNNGNARAALGCNEKFIVLDNDQFNDVTPFRLSATVNNPFTTTSGSNIVRVDHSNHGGDEGDHVYFDNASAVGGITIDGEYTITSVISNNAYNITHTSAASSSAGPGGGSVDIDYEIHIGQESATHGSGYGVGGYGSGTYGTARSSFVLLPPRTWQIEQWQAIIVACPRGGEILKFENNVANRAELIANAPTNNTSILVTEELHLLALGANGNKMGVDWCDQGDFDEWTPSDQTTAGQRQLTGGSEIQCAVRTNGGNLILTDASAWFMQFIGGQDVFGFDQRAGSHAGGISPKCMIDVDGIALWMGFSDFYYFDGVVRRIPNSSDIHSTVYDNLTDEQKSKCFAYPVTHRNEVWWFYPTTDEITHYVKYQYKDRCWDLGSLVRTAGIDRGIFLNPFMTGTDSFLYDHEKKNYYDDAGNPMGDYIISGPLRWKDGDREIEIVGLEPDFQVTGTITVELISRHSAQGSETTDSSSDMQAIAGTEDWLSIRAAGREVDTKIASNGTGSYWRLGALTYDIIPGAFL